MRQPRVIGGLLVATVVLVGAQPAETSPRDGGDELFKLTAADAQAEWNVGIAAAVSGGTAIVGSHLAVSGGVNSGAAYLFDTATGVELRKLTPLKGAAGDQFGYAVAIEGNTALVGARYDNAAGADAGAAYLFDVETGLQRLKLTASDAAAGDNFGAAVAISGNLVIVGAEHDDHAGANAGSAYVFNADTGTELFKLTAADAAAGDRFGVSVDISGQHAIVGAVWDDDAGLNSGAAYLFDMSTGAELRKLTASDAEATDYFGQSVAISGERALIGAFWESEAGTRAGAAYLFAVDTGDELHKLIAADATPGNLFGFAVDLDGSTAVIGARNQSNAGYASGSGYLFDAGTGTELFKLTAADAAANDFLGYAVGVSGAVAIAGAPGDDGIGAAYLFDATHPQTAAPGAASLAFGSLSATPNPFLRGTRLSFSLPQAGAANVEIFDPRGRRVRRLAEGRWTAGVHALTWDGADDRGRALPAGVYLARVHAGPAVAARRVVLLR